MHYKAHLLLRRFDRRRALRQLRPRVRLHLPEGRDGAHKLLARWDLEAGLVNLHAGVTTCETACGSM